MKNTEIISKIRKICKEYHGELKPHFNEKLISIYTIGFNCHKNELTFKSFTECLEFVEKMYN